MQTNSEIIDNDDSNRSNSVPQYTSDEDDTSNEECDESDESDDSYYQALI